MAFSEDEEDHHTPTRQSIPLQDLSRPTDDQSARAVASASTPAPASVDNTPRTPRTRNSIGARLSISGRKYQRLSEHSPSRQERSRRPPPLHPLDTSGAYHHARVDDFDDRDVSPLQSQDRVSDALGFAGLTVADTAATVSPVRRVPDSEVSHDGPRHSPDVSPCSTPTGRLSAETRRNASFSADTDTVPLTDGRGRQRSPANSWLPTPRTPDRDRDRTSFQTVRLSEHGGSPRTMLGDDLWAADAEPGRSPDKKSARGRSASATISKLSLSPSSAVSPLERARTMVRNMSQRVVNLSNEPEIVAQSLRKSSSAGQAASRPTSVGLDGAEPAVFAPSPVGKAPPLPLAGKEQSRWQQRTNPLKGKALGIFSANNPLRTGLCEALVHPVTEPVILGLIITQTVLLAVDSGSNVYKDHRSKRWGTSWIDYGLLCLFVIYTIELAVRIIVSGFVLNAEEYSTVNRQEGIRAAAAQRLQAVFAPHHDAVTEKKILNPLGIQQASILRSFTTMQADIEHPDHTRQQQRIRLAHRAFLRHSFNRLDLVAVLSYWISFVLALSGAEADKHLYVFRMLSCLRILRLLGITTGTSVLLRSLKKAAPLLVNVAFLIGFFWLLFAILGVQSFKSSLRRTCVWVDPEGIRGNFTQVRQFCGGQINNITLQPESYFFADGSQNQDRHKGYLCPPGSLCVQKDNPYKGTVSFDNILHSLELVFVIMSTNTFSELMYHTTNSDYLFAAFFFAAGIVLLSLWLMNLLVAVITSSFQVIREESKTSPFTGAEDARQEADRPDPAIAAPRASSLKRFHDRTARLWIGVIVYGLVAQCFRSADMGRARARFIDVSETIVTALLVVEILFRFVADWRHFHKRRHNWIDLGLAVITAVLQAPRIHNSGRLYAWFSVFQIARIYRVILATSITRELLVIVFGNASGILNLVLFVFLITFLAAIFAAQMFRGEIPQYDDNGKPIRVTFFNIYNSFLGMYQVLSSENWTSVMYNVTNYTKDRGTSWIGASFFVLWFILANFIVLNMFIAVIQENFDVSEDEKRLYQIKAFLQQKQLGSSSDGNLSLATILKLGRGQRKRDPLDHGPATLEMLLKEAVVRDFLDEEMERASVKPSRATTTIATQSDREGRPGFVKRIWTRLFSRFYNREPNPFYTGLKFSASNDELDPSAMAKEVVSATEKRKRAQREYLLKHPSYNVSLCLFKPSNPVRKACQSMVGPGRGRKRVEGIEPIKAIWYTFSAFIYASIVAMVVIACVTTPLYQHLKGKKDGAKHWFVYADLGFTVVFTVELIIKLIADGFLWTPNAYFRGLWGLMDGVVLVTLWVDVITSLLGIGEVSRAVGAFKALRALRLLNVSDNARNTFHSVMILGARKVASAVFVSFSLLVPFAIYGLNLFHGRMRQCNDDGPAIQTISRDCVGEYANRVSNWDVWSPRAASNPGYSFDDFGSSLFILFQIVSQEGWTDVMWSAQSVTGPDRQPRPFASQGNALFFVVFNLLGAVFVLTLFVSVLMRNYTEQTGVAFLTAEQRSWLETRKLLRQISPSKRPSNKPSQKWRDWCYRQAINKRGGWQRFITAILVLHLVLLLLEFYPSKRAWDLTREYLFFVFTLLYIANILIRLVGLTWTQYCKSSWNLYSLFVVSGAFVTTIQRLGRMTRRAVGQHPSDQLNKLFLVSVTLLLIPRNNQLDQLFKTAAASFPTIGNLLATWFVLFLAYAIALTQTLGLTKFGPLEDGNINFRTVPKALILLFRMSCGEGWNRIMEDFATMTEPQCVRGRDFLRSDCGSAVAARTLLLSWNILSMYLFVNLFVSLIYESFSYVYQRSSTSSAISRTEIRRFKDAWAMFDPDGTGYMPKQTFPRFLAELSGIFEMRVYDGDFTIRKMLEDSRPDGTSVPTRVVDGVLDLDKLARRLAQIPVNEIARRRQRLNAFYEEAMVSADMDRGVSFTMVLLLLAHYKVINENKCLRLEEFLRRRARSQRVDEQVRRNVVVGFFNTLYWMRRIQRAVEARRRRASRPQQTLPPQLAVPEIVVAGADGGVIAADNLAAADDDGYDDSPSVSPVSSVSLTLSLSHPQSRSRPHSLSLSASSSLGGGGSGSLAYDVRPAWQQAQHSSSVDTGAASFGQLRNRAGSSPPSPTGPLSGAELVGIGQYQQQQQYHQQQQQQQQQYRHGDDGNIGGSSGNGGGVSGGDGDNANGSRPRHESSSAMATRRQSVLDALDNSAWGDSIRRSLSAIRPR